MSNRADGVFTYERTKLNRRRLVESLLELSCSFISLQVQIHSAEPRNSTNVAYKRESQRRRPGIGAVGSIWT